MKAIVKQGYLYTEPRDANADIAVGAQAWFDWLDQHDHFVFQGDDDRFTARQETIRGGSYWYGYRRRKGRLYKVYLGRAADLTLDKLHAAEGKFTQREQPAAESALAPLSALDLATSLRTVVVSARQRENAAVTNLPFTLLTRLIPPALPTSLIARPRLLQQISTPITLVTAPSGFGKTTLVNQWRTARLTNPPTTPPSTAPQSPKIVWISLETDERNPHSFWATMMAALEQSEIDTGKSASALLQSPTHVSLEQILANFIQTISRWQASQPAHQLVLILDNYQRVRSTDIDAACQFFLDHLPPNVQMVLTSQAQFPFAVQRWRAQGILAELTADDLLLTPEEGAAYLDRIATIPLTAREKLSLSVRAGGWAAGLNLLALALKKQEDVHRFIATFDGKHPFLQTYFVEEILARQPAEIQAFLLQTSILRNLQGSLCDSVTQQRGSQQNNAKDHRCYAHVKADEPGFGLTARKGIVKTGGRAHVQKARKLLEQVGCKAVVAVHLRPKCAGQNSLHGKVDRNGGDIGHKLEDIAAGQSGGRALHAGKLAHFGGALKSGRPYQQKIPAWAAEICRREPAGPCLLAQKFAVPSSFPLRAQGECLLFIPQGYRHG